MKLGRRLSPVLSVLAAVLLLACGGKTEADSIDAARNLLAKGDFGSAAIELKSVLQKSPNLGEARYLLGVALIEQGEYGAALMELTKAQDQNFNSDLLSPKMARVLLATGKFKEVVQRYSAAVLKSPALQAELSTAVAVAHARMNQLKESESALDQALNADPKFVWALLTKARIRMAAGKFDEALAMIDAATVAGAPNGDAHILRAAILRFAKKDIEGAIKSYLAAAQDPKEVQGARRGLIQLSLEQHRLDDAKAQLVELQKTHPKNPQTHLLDAMVAYASKEYGRTGTITDELLRLAPDDPQLLVLGGAANLRQGALIAAEAKLGKVVQTVERMTAARKMLAETYLQMGQAEKSLATLRPLLEQAKPDGDALAQAGQAYLQLGNPQQAEVAFSAAVKAKPEDFQVRTALALTEFLKGNSEAALASLQQIAAKDPGETADLALVSAHMRRRDFDAALKAIDSLERKAPTKATALHMRGLALLGKGDRKAARGSFEAALKVEPLHFASVASLASLDLQEKDPEAAVKRLTAAVKLDPKNTMARMVLLDVRTRQQATPSDLLVIIDDAIKAAPNDSAPRVARISFFAKANDTKAATSAAQDALAVLPLNPDVLDAAGRAFSAAGDDQQAVSAFNKLAGTMQRGALPYLRLADLHSKRGDSSAVVSSLNRALEAAPDSAEVHRRFLGHAVKNRDFKPVLSAAKELQKKLPHSAVGFLLEGDAEAARKSWQAATQAYRAALKLGGADGRPQKALYAALLASGDKEAAEKFAGDWLKSAPRDVGFRENLGDRAIARKDYVSAERLFREVLALQPGHPAGLNNLAWLMAERGVKGASDVAAKALKAAPESAPVMDTVAKALASEGMLDRAVDMQKQAIATMPDRHVYRLNLARLFIRAGKHQEAAAELSALSKLDAKLGLQPEVDELRKQLPK